MSLKLLTLNAWTGFDAHGQLRMGRYESDAEQKRRRSDLIAFIREADPDIVALQEVCPILSSAREIAAGVGGSFRCQIANAGVKLFGYGFPIGFSEGLMVIARHGLSIRDSSSLRLSGPSTLFWRELLAWQTAETRWLMEVEVQGYDHPLHIFNVHTHFSPPLSPALLHEVAQCAESAGLDKGTESAALAGLQRRQSELQSAFDYVYWVTEGEPAVVLGDLNTEPAEEWFRALMTKDGITDVLALDAPPTWDPLHNPLAELSTSFRFPTGKGKKGLDIISAVYDRVAKRVDYILLKAFPGSSKVARACVVPSNNPAGCWFSDHSAVVAEIDSSARG